MSVTVTVSRVCDCMSEVGPAQRTSRQWPRAQCQQRAVHQIAPLPSHCPRPTPLLPIELRLNDSLTTLALTLSLTASTSAFVFTMVGLDSLDDLHLHLFASNVLALLLAIQLYLGGQGRIVPVFTTSYYHHVQSTWQGTKDALPFVPLSPQSLNTVLGVLMLVASPLVAWDETRQLGALLTIGLTGLGWYTLRHQGVSYIVPQINMALSFLMLLCS